MPLYKAVYDYKKTRYRFHMPGHKAGKLIKKYFGNANFDITELSFSDNLLNAEGVIKKAESLCAKCYNAEAVKFATCGTTVNILALIHSLKNYGNNIIIARNSHKSVYSALQINNIEPIIIDNVYNNNNLYSQITAQDIENALKDNKYCIGVFVTSPDYYGFCADLDGIAKVVKKYGKLLLVDSAHGSHLPFAFENIYKNADIYVCSAHKTLLAFTPASFAVFNNYRLYEGFLKSLNIFHTSSPSYAILASIDFSREFMQKNGSAKLSELKALSQKYKTKLEDCGFKSVQNDDFTKLIISKQNITGYKLEKLLEKKGIYCELADENYVMALFSVADGKKSYKKLYKTLKSLKIENNAISKTNYFKPSALIKAIPYLKAYNAKKQLLPLQNAAGRIAATDAGIFPPSYPLICCGEILTQDLCNFLLNNKERAFGLDNDSICVVK